MHHAARVPGGAGLEVASRYIAINESNSQAARSGFPVVVGSMRQDEPREFSITTAVIGKLP
jgi:hypothetical protein